MRSCLLTACVVFAGAVSALPGATLERQLVLMGTEVRVHLEGEDRVSLLVASKQAIAAIEAVEKRLSTWRPDSELSRLNEAPVGEPFALTRETADDLAAARRCWRATAGGFDPGIGGLVEVWGLRSGGRLPAPEEIRRVHSEGGLAALELAAGSAVRRRPGLRLEEGAFGKGIALDRALAALAGVAGITAAWIDLGGQVAVLDGRGRRQVLVADPSRRDQSVLRVEITAGSLATTGNSERGIEIAGRRFGHILDPRGGRPVEDFGSLTVWASSSLRADCLATGLYVLGPEAALTWATEHDGVEAIVVRPSPRGPLITATAGFNGRLIQIGSGVLEFFDA